MTVEQTLAELVAIDSVSSRSNAAIISYLQQRCESRGLLVRTYPHVDGNGETKINLVAQTSVCVPAQTPQVEACATVELVLVGHTDTVPYDPAWTDALHLTEDDGKLFGRGACDTKAFIAAALTAVAGLELKNLRRPLALLFTADEEIGLIGAKRFADERRMRARLAGAHRIVRLISRYRDRGLP